MDSLRIIGSRLKISLIMLKRDPKVRIMFILAILFIGLLYLNMASAKMERKIKIKYNFLKNGLASFQVGFFFSFTMFACFIVTFGEYFNERKNKMISFLFSVGMSRLEYYGSYVIWNWILTTFMMSLTVWVITLQSDGSPDMIKLLVACVFGSIGTTLFGTSLIIFFGVDSTANSSYMLINSMACGGIGVLADKRTLMLIADILPAGKVLDVTLMETFKPECSPTYGGLLYVQFCQIVGYLILAIILENVSKNEFGFHHANYIFRSTTKKDYNEPNTISDTNDLEEKLGDFIGQEHTVFSRHPNQANLMLEIDNVKKSFTNNTVLQGVSFSALKGEISCILGANGAGKSTLFNIILDNIEYESGEVRKHWGNRPVSFCPQEDVGWEIITIEEHIQFVRRIKEIKDNSQTTSPEHLAKIIDICSLESHWTKRVKELSGGFKRRMTIAMALLANPDIILMDEPTTALDMEIRFEIMKGFYRIRDEIGTTILYTTHHLEDAENFSDKILMLAKGKIIIGGSMDQLRQKFNIATLKVSSLNDDSLSKAQEYFNKSFDQSTASMTIDTKTSTMNIKLPYSPSDPSIINHMKYYENELKAIVELKQTTLEDIYLMEGDFERYRELENFGKSDLNTTWAKLLDMPKDRGFIISLLQVFKKSSQK